MNRSDQLRVQRAKREYVDGTVLTCALILSALGILMVFSITGTSIFNNQAGDRLIYMTHSATSVMLGIVGMGMAAFIPNRWYRGRLAFLIFLITAVIFIITPILGRDTLASPGVQRWLEIGPIVFQAVDLARIGFVISLAWMIHLLIEKRMYYSSKLWSSYLIPLIYVFVCTFTVIRQPDLGSAFVILGTGIIVFLSSGLAVKQIMVLLLMASTLAGSVAVFGVYAFNNLEAYQVTRIAVWLDPFNHDLGLQSVMGFVSIALGGWFGVGLGKSTQALGFAIEPHTDLIVTILAEELGFIAVLIVMILYFSIAVRCFLTSLRARDVFSALVCIGVGAFFLLQPFVNLGGASGIIPLSGVALPLISYGMTNKISTFIMIGIYFNMRRHILLTEAIAVCADKKADLEREEKLKKKVVQFPKVVN